MFQETNNEKRREKPKSPEQRLEICTGGMWLPRCPELDVQNGRCKRCRCFVNQKVKVFTESCPLGKW